MRKVNPVLWGFASSLILSLSLSGCGGGGGGASFASDDDSPDPVVVDIPIAYIKRPAPEEEDGVVRYTDLDDPIEMFAGARLLIRPRSSNLANEIDLTDRIVEIIATELDADPDLLAIDIKGLEASFDGSQLLFSVRAIPDIENNNEPELFTWNLWRYDFEEDTLSYVINSSLVRDEGADTGSGHDMEPHFLTDDRIVFSSSRQAAIQEKQLNEGRGQRYSPLADDRNVQAVGLHVIDPDTQEISQISLGSTADLHAATLETGELIFNRRNDRGIYSLYQINPSGAQDSVLYGGNSSALVASEESAFGVSGDIHFMHPREMPDGRILTLLLPDARSTLGGDIALIDTEGFVELFTTTTNYSGGDSRAQIALSDLEVNALDEFSPAGKYLSAYPLQDGSERILVSWSPCRVENGDGLIRPCSIATDDDRVDDGNGNLTFEPAPPLFGLWLYNPNDQTQLPVVIAEEGFIISEAITAEPRVFPRAPDESDIFDASLAQENKGLIIIDSVYNEDDGLVNFGPLGPAIYAEPGTAAYTNRPARFMRVIQPIPEPNRDVINPPNQGGRYGMLEILGYVPVEPDGSVSVVVPANTPLMLNTLRDDVRRISRRHEHWISVAPGEVLRCVGCHDPSSNIPHGRLDSLPPSQNPGAISLSSGLTGFPGTTSALFASELGQTMAEVYDDRKPDLDTSERVRELQLEVTYSDEWTDTLLATPDADINLTYDPAWELPEAFPIISPNLDPSLQGRIVINYSDHIQAIWEREREITQDGEEVLAPDGITPATNCISCHNSYNNTVVPAGQLDLSATETNNFTIAYEELTRGDVEYWYIDEDSIAVRERICDEVDPNGNPIQVIENFPVPAAVNSGGAIASQAFFNCFENNNPDFCGRYTPDRSLPPANCTDDGGTITDDSLTTKRIPDTFAEAETLMDNKDMVADGTPSLIEPDELMELLNTNCGQCHSTTPTDPSPGTAPSFPHGDDDPDTAYASMIDYISLVNPSASTLVTRLRVQNHNCWDMDGDTSADCEENAVAMETAISSFADAVPEEDITIPGGSTASDASFNHFGLLSESELRLISEWLDTGGAFYNNPFDPRLYE